MRRALRLLDTWGPLVLAVAAGLFFFYGGHEVVACISVDWITDTCTESEYYWFFN